MKSTLKMEMNLIKVVYYVMSEKKYFWTAAK